ncbi:MAG: PilZ domain-containing protein [Candidatus Koribacter versatilis]|nr:PilZ domain-containing protein [Candidatus Koribacter versatilis]
MSLKSLLMSSDEKTVRILRRVLSDLEIGVEHCASAEAAIRRLTRQRFEAIIVDCSDPVEAGSVLRSAKAAPANNRAIAVVLVESPVGLRGGFEMGAHFVLHKPLSGERAKTSFRAVRALMKRERRRQLRVAVQIPVECRAFGSAMQYKAKTLDLCEGGMALQFPGPIPKENSLRFSLDLPGMDRKLELEGELAWEGHSEQAGVRFQGISEEQRDTLRHWLNSQLPEPEQDDPPVSCVLTDLSLGGCYLKTNSPFPRGTRVTLSMKTGDLQVRAGGVVRVTHPEFGMGVEFMQATSQQHNQVHQMIETLRANGDKSPELQVEPDGLETSSLKESSVDPQVPGTEDALLELFRHKSQAPVEAFLQQMREQRHSVESR